MAETTLRDLHTNDHIRCLMAIAWAAEEWSGGRITDDDLRSVVREQMLEYTGEAREAVTP